MPIPLLRDEEAKLCYLKCREAPTTGTGAPPAPRSPAARLLGLVGAARFGDRGCLHGGARPPHRAPSRPPRPRSFLFSACLQISSEVFLPRRACTFAPARLAS